MRFPGHLGEVGVSAVWTSLGRGVHREEAQGSSPRGHGRELGTYHLCASLPTSISPGLVLLLYIWEDENVPTLKCGSGCTTE